ncbi:MAG TPA: cellulase family glycosylhydrolase [Polyangia bacterium]|nr:cellulase family glycosylhydrolase [Polyangia bacterium]
MNPSPRTLAFPLLFGFQLVIASNASATTNQFRGVNWADSGDNFQAGVIYVSGLSSSDTYSSALATGTSVMTQFVSKLGANAVRMPINEATVSGYWGTYTGAIDAVVSKGIVVLCYWDSAKSNKPADMTAYWNMWKTVIDKYGGNENAYFEVFNEPNMYSTSDLISLYSSWLTQFPSVPKSRVILDGTGDAQNVPNIGSASALDGCLLGVHDYSFFGSDTWTSDAQWVSQFKGEVGSYADRTVCTEWGGPMSPGSKNGVSYGSLDYSKSPTNYFEAYIQGMSSQLRASNMGSFYWAGLKDGDWYSMTTRSGTGSSLVLSVPNRSGLAELQNAWTGPPPSNDDAGAGGSSGGGGSDSGGRGGSAAGAGGTAGAGGAGGGAGSGTGGRSGAGGSGGGASAGTGGRSAVGGGGDGGAGGTQGEGGAAAGGQGGVTGTSTATGGTTGAASGGAGSGGSSTAASESGAGCSCTTARASGRDTGPLAFVLGAFALWITRGRGRRRPLRGRVAPLSPSLGPPAPEERCASN